MTPELAIYLADVANSANIMAAFIAIFSMFTGTVATLLFLIAGQSPENDQNARAALCVSVIAVSVLCISATTAILVPRGDTIREAAGLPLLDKLGNPGTPP